LFPFLLLGSAVVFGPQKSTHSLIENQLNCKKKNENGKLSAGRWLSNEVHCAMSIKRNVVFSSLSMDSHLSRHSFRNYFQ
jgi:hypothetical protein